MKALIYTKQNSDISSIMDSEGIGYAGLRDRLPVDALNIEETTVEKLPSNPKWDGDKYVSSELDSEVIAESLREDALAYQSSQQSQNELGILHGYTVEELTSKPKAFANINWMTSLFTLQRAKEADLTNDTPFSSVGDKPHSFTEIYEEKWGI